MVELLSFNFRAFKVQLVGVQNFRILTVFIT